MKFSISSGAIALLTFAAVSLAGCNASTSSSSLDSNSALQSLALGLTQLPLGYEDSPSPAEIKASFAAIAPLLDRVSVTVDGVSQEMYAFSTRATFPAGTCAEAVFTGPQAPRLPGACTPLNPGIQTFLWQTRSAAKAPEKLIMIISDIGTNGFDHSTVTMTFPSDGKPNVQQPFFQMFAVYAAAGKLFGAKSGSITSSMTPSGSNCEVPLDPFAKSETCHFAKFTVSGAIEMGESMEQGPAASTVSLGIPPIAVDGLLIDVTAMQPIKPSTNRAPTGAVEKLQPNGQQLPTQR